MRAIVESLKRYGFFGVLLVTVLASTPFLYGMFLQSIPTWVKVLISVAFVVLTFVYNYYKDVRPLLSFAERRDYFFDLACASPLEDLRQNFDRTARLNVMEVGRKLPMRRSEFRPLYTLNMEGDLDKDLGLKIYQGATGMAFRDKRFYVANLEDPDGLEYHFDERQLRLTKDLTLICSMPIRRVRKLSDDSRDITDEVIGVVNIDSKMPNARAFYGRSRVESTFREGEEVSLLEEVEATLDKISETCSWIMS
jgi:hypothetical protein